MPPGKPSIYALLVGVNEYKQNSDSSSPRSLYGCLNDVKNMEVLLSKFTEKRTIQTKTLLNHEATYKAVIQAFKDHLYQAKSGDTALFYYSGHGTREAQTPDEFLQFFSTHQTENLVCYDGCTQNGLTLADKELAVLISEIPKGVHVVVILDACHSGSATRQDNDRMTDPFDKKRTLDQYLDGWFSKQLSNEGKITLPHREHILLAAADRRQSAKEDNLGGEMAGAFSYFLNKALNASLSSNSYHHVMGHVADLLRVNHYQQLPQLEPIGGASAYDQFLLGEYAGDAQYSRVFYKKGYRIQPGVWQIELGAIHGLQLDAVRYKNIPIFANLSDQKAVGYARIVKLGLQVSTIRLEPGTRLNSSQYYWTWMSARPLQVHVDEADLRQLNLKDTETHDHVPIIQFSHDYAASRLYRLKREGDYWKIYAGARMLCGVKGTESNIFIYNQLLTIAKQENLLKLNSPSGSNLDADKLELRLESVGDLLRPSPKDGIDYECQVRATGAGYTKIPYKAIARHGFGQEVYFALYSLNADFSINVLNIDQDPRRADHEVQLYNFELTSIPAAPQSIYSDFILIASLAPIKAGTLEQPGIPFKALWQSVDLDSPVDESLRDGGLRIRHARFGQREGDTAVDWVLRQVRVEIVKG